MRGYHPHSFEDNADMVSYTELFVLTRSDTNQAVQPQKMARGFKFWIKEVEGLYCLCSENKDADQLRDTVQLICAFVFAYAKSRFPHDVDHI